MRPYQFNEYLKALYLSDEDLSWLLELPRTDFDEMRCTVQRYKQGEIEYPAWLQPLFMRMLTLYQQQFPVLIENHAEQQPYATLQNSKLHPQWFRRDIHLYLPEEDEEEIDTFLHPEEELQRLRQQLKNEIKLIQFSCPAELLKGIGKERFALYDGCLGLYNGFVTYAAARLRITKTPYERVYFISAEQYQRASDDVDDAMREGDLEYWNALNSVVPLHPSPEYLAEKAELQEVIQSYT